jgi:hypothetical protein
MIPGGGAYRGHNHFWQRAMARRQFMRVAGGTAALLAAGLRLPAVAEAGAGSQVLPKPIPGGLPFDTIFGLPGNELFHVFPPGFPDKGAENSTITDFNGAIGSAHILGTATQFQGGVATRGLQVDGDIRFMQGTYVGVDGGTHNGTIGFF